MPVRPVLVVQHEDQCPPGWVGEWLTDAGVALDVRRPYAGEHLPEDLASHAGLVVLGGHMGAKDDSTVPWLPATKVLLREAAATGIPALGICLGHQLAAVALGGEVVANPAGKRRGVLDMGWEPVAAGDPMVSGCGSRGVMWHNDIVTREPEGTVVLGRGARGELTAARFAPTVWGVQCHPEAGADVVAVWAASDAASARTSRAVRLEIDQRLGDVSAATQELRAGWEPVAKSLAAMVSER